MHFVFLTKFPLSSLFSMLIVRSSSLTPLHAFFYSSSTKQFDCQDSGSILSILHFLLVAPSMLWFRLPVPDNNGGTALTFLAKRGAPIPFSDEIHFLYGSSPTTLFIQVFSFPAVPADPTFNHYLGWCNGNDRLHGITN